MPKISIIVPVYNVEKYLEKCIDSILNQTFKDFELILVDDGSTDNSGNICDEYRKKDRRIKVIHKSNGGLSSARNAGLDIALGKFIAFVDSDDYIHHQMYEIMYSFIKNENADLCICNYEIVDDYYNIKKNNIEIQSNMDIEVYNSIESLEKIYSSKGLEFVVAWSKLYDRSLFDDLRFEEGRIHEDEFIVHKILYNSIKTIYCPYKFYYYFQRDDSIMKSRTKITKIDYIDALSDRINFFNGKNLINLKNKTEYIYISNFFELYYYSKDNYSKKIYCKLHKSFRQNLLILLNNSIYSNREKLSWIIFLLYPNIYKRLFYK